MNIYEKLGVVFKTAARDKGTGLLMPYISTRDMGYQDIKSALKGARRIKYLDKAILAEKAGDFATRDAMLLKVHKNGTNNGVKELRKLIGKDNVSFKSDKRPSLEELEFALKREQSKFMPIESKNKINYGGGKKPAHGSDIYAGSRKSNVIHNILDRNAAEAQGKAYKHRQYDVGTDFNNFIKDTVENDYVNGIRKTEHSFFVPDTLIADNLRINGTYVNQDYIGYNPDGSHLVGTMYGMKKSDADKIFIRYPNMGKAKSRYARGTYIGTYTDAKGRTRKGMFERQFQVPNREWTNAQSDDDIIRTAYGKFTGIAPGSNGVVRSEADFIKALDNGVKNTFNSRAYLSENKWNIRNPKQVFGRKMITPSGSVRPGDYKFEPFRPNMPGWNGSTPVLTEEDRLNMGI